MALAIVVAFSLGCGSLLRSNPPAAPDEQPLTQVDDDENEDPDEPRKQKAPPPQYGHRMVRDGSSADEPKASTPKPPAVQQSH